MIRLNAFFVLKEDASLEELKAITDELVAKSRTDEGNLGYDLFQSTTNPRVMMFCESWENQEVLENRGDDGERTKDREVRIRKPGGLRSCDSEEY